MFLMDALSVLFMIWQAYCQSKLANILFSKAFADHMKVENFTQVTSVSVHPGVIQSALWRNVPSLVTSFMSLFWFDKSIPQGAATTVWACVAPQIDSEEYRGVYLSDCDVVTPSDAAVDIRLR